MLKVSLEKNDGGVLRFWQICVEENCATVVYGLVQGVCDCSAEEFESMEEAIEHAMEQIFSKTDQGYVRQGEVQKEGQKKRKATQDIEDVELGQRLVPFQAAKKLKSGQTKVVTKKEKQAAKRKTPAQQNSQQSDQIQIDLNNSKKELITIDLTHDPNIVELEINEAGVRRFWQVCVEENCVNSWSGTSWNRGKFYSREFETAEEAEEYADKQIEYKRLIGWKKVRKQNNTQKRKSEVKLEKKQKKKQKKEEVITYQSKKNIESTRKKQDQKVSGGGYLPPRTCGPLGHVDPSSKLKGKIYKDSKGTNYDVMLLKRSLKQDYYYILQLVVCNESHDTKYNIFTRWGQVQSMGRGNIIQADDLESAINYFADKFEDKTGQDWFEREKYRVQQDMHEWMKGDRKRVSQQPSQRSTNIIDKSDNRNCDNNSMVGNKNNRNVGGAQVRLESLMQNYSRPLVVHKELVGTSRNAHHANNVQNVQNANTCSGRQANNVQNAQNVQNGNLGANINHVQNIRNDNFDIIRNIRNVQNVQNVQNARIEKIANNRNVQNIRTENVDGDNNNNYNNEENGFVNAQNVLQTQQEIISSRNLNEQQNQPQNISSRKQVLSKGHTINTGGNNTNQNANDDRVNHTQNNIENQQLQTAPQLNKSYNINSLISTNNNKGGSQNMLETQNYQERQVSSQVQHCQSGDNRNMIVEKTREIQKHAENNAGKIPTKQQQQLVLPQTQVIISQTQQDDNSTSDNNGTLVFGPQVRQMQQSQQILPQKEVASQLQKNMKSVRNNDGTTIDTQVRQIQQSQQQFLRGKDAQTNKNYENVDIDANNRMQNLQAGLSICISRKDPRNSTSNVCISSSTNQPSDANVQNAQNVQHAQNVSNVAHPATTLILPTTNTQNVRNAQNVADIACHATTYSQSTTNAQNVQNVQNVHNVSNVADIACPTITLNQPTTTNAQNVQNVERSSARSDDAITSNEHVANVQNVENVICERNTSVISLKKVESLSKKKSSNDKNCNLEKSSSTLNIQKQQKVSQTLQNTIIEGNVNQEANNNNNNNDNVIRIISNGQQNRKNLKALNSSENQKFKRVTTNLENGFMIQHFQNTQHVQNVQHGSNVNVQHGDNAQNVSLIQENCTTKNSEQNLDSAKQNEEDFDIYGCFRVTSPSLSMQQNKHNIPQNLNLSTVENNDDNATNQTTVQNKQSISTGQNVQNDNINEIVEKPQNETITEATYVNQRVQDTPLIQQRTQIISRSPLNFGRGAQDVSDNQLNVTKEDAENACISRKNAQNALLEAQQITINSRDTPMSQQDVQNIPLNERCVSQDVQNVSATQENVQKAKDVSQDAENIQNVTVYPENVQNSLQYVSANQENVQNAKDISQEAQNVQNVATNQENTQNAKDISQDAQNVQNVATNQENTQNAKDISQDAQNVQNVATNQENVQNSLQNVSANQENIQNAKDVSQHVQNVQNVSDVQNVQDTLINNQNITIDRTTNSIDLFVENMSALDQNKQINNFSKNVDFSNQNTDQIEEFLQKQNENLNICGDNSLQSLLNHALHQYQQYNANNLNVTHDTQVIDANNQQNATEYANNQQINQYSSNFIIEQLQSLISPPNNSNYNVQYAQYVQNIQNTAMNQQFHSHHESYALINECNINLPQTEDQHVQHVQHANNVQNAQIFAAQHGKNAHIFNSFDVDVDNFCEEHENMLDFEQCTNNQVYQKLQNALINQYNANEKQYQLKNNNCDFQNILDFEQNASIINEHNQHAQNQQNVQNCDNYQHVNNCSKIINAQDMYYSLMDIDNLNNINTVQNNAIEVCTQKNNDEKIIYINQINEDKEISISFGDQNPNEFESTNQNSNCVLNLSDSFIQVEFLVDEKNLIQVRFHVLNLSDFQNNKHFVNKVENNKHDQNGIQKSQKFLGDVDVVGGKQINHSNFQNIEENSINSVNIQENQNIQENIVNVQNIEENQINSDNIQENQNIQENIVNIQNIEENLIYSDNIQENQNIQENIVNVQNIENNHEDQFGLENQINQNDVDNNENIQVMFSEGGGDTIKLGFII